MSTIEQTVRLAAPPERVFDFATDPSHFSQYIASFAGWRAGAERATGVGAIYAWTGALGPLRLQATEQVTEWRAPWRAAYAGELARVRFRSSFDLARRDDGGTRLTVRVDYQVLPRMGGTIIARAVRPVVARALRRSLAALTRALGEGPGSADGALDRAEVIELYRRRARGYDRTTQLYRLLAPVARYRRLAVDALGLASGQTVVELGCGTGANFDLLEQRVGPGGRIIGVDLTDAMLQQAARRVRARGWHNVELVQSDAAAYQWPATVHGIVSTLALTLCPDFELAIERGARALAPGGRFVVLDLKRPEGFPSWAIALGLLVTRGYGVTLGAGARHPWETIARHFPRHQMRELFPGVTYLAVGEKA